VRWPGLTRGGRSLGLVWRTPESVAWRLDAGATLFVNVNYRCGPAKQRPDETGISVGRTARGRCVCYFGRANLDRLRGKHRAFSEQPWSRICRTNQLWTLRLPHSRGDGFGSFAAVSIAIRGHDTVFAFSRVRDRYTVHRDIVVAIVGTTHKPAAWGGDTKSSDTARKLGIGRRAKVSFRGAPVFECGLKRIIRCAAEIAGSDLNT